MADIQSVLTAAVAAGVNAAVSNPDTAAQHSDKPIITSAVVAAVTPIVANATNSEPWYKSRVTIGNYVAMAGVLIGPLVGHTFSVDEQALATTIITGVISISGAAYSLYGRWAAKKPLGS